MKALVTKATPILMATKDRKTCRSDHPVVAAANKACRIEDTITNDTTAPCR
jgi:hypothetical protein